MIDIFQYYNQVESLDFQLSKTIQKAADHCYKTKLDDCGYETSKALGICSKEFVKLREIYLSMYKPYSFEERTIQRELLRALEIKIEKMFNEPPVYKITLPFIIPNQRTGIDVWKDTIGYSLFNALDDFSKSERVKRIDKSIIVFVSNYVGNQIKYVADNDNKEVKNIINIISKTLIKDDNGLLCDLFFTSRLSPSLSTEIYVAPKEQTMALLNLIFLSKR